MKQRAFGASVTESSYPIGVSGRPGAEHKTSRSTEGGHQQFPLGGRPRRQ
ncbi:hypothetical protein [Williamsia sp.]